MSKQQPHVELCMRIFINKHENAGLGSSTTTKNYIAHVWSAICFNNSELHTSLVEKGKKIHASERERGEKVSIVVYASLKTIIADE
jgi:hypothetical protein